MNTLSVSVSVSNLAFGVVILLLGLLLAVWVANSYRDLKRLMKTNRMTFRQIANVGGFIGTTVFSLVCCVLGVVLMVS